MDVDDKPAWVDCALVCRPQWYYCVFAAAESLPTKSEATLQQHSKDVKIGVLSLYNESNLMFKPFLLYRHH